MKGKRIEMLLTHQICGDHQSDVHGTFIIEGHLVSDVDTWRRCPLTDLDQGVRLQFEEVKLEIGAAAFTKLNRSC